MLCCAGNLRVRGTRGCWKPGTERGWERLQRAEPPVWACHGTVTAGNHCAVWLWEIPLPVVPSSLGFFHYTCVLFQLANTSFAQSGIHSRVLTWSLLGSKLTKLYLTISKVHNTAAKNRADKGSPWNSSSMGIKSMSFLTQLRDRHLLEESYLHLSVVLRYFLSPATWHGAISA